MTVRLTSRRAPGRKFGKGRDCVTMSLVELASGSTEADRGFGASGILTTSLRIARLTEESRMKGNAPVLELQPVIENLPAGFDALRAEARAEGYSFIERLAADWEAHKMRFEHQGEALLVAHVAGELAGIGGLTIDPVLPGALRMRRFYIRRPFRRLGIGRKLATALLERARSTSRLVTVNAAPASVPFWETLGFTPDRRDGHTHLRYFEAGGS
jgi:GNAT superfamily N-acetyltransferase